MTNPIKSKVRQLYRFLKKLNELRYPPVRTLSAQEKVIWLADVPLHPTIQLSQPKKGNEEGADRQDFQLRVKRPTQTPCPAVPQPLRDWIKPGYDDPAAHAAVVPALNVIVERRFSDDPQRLIDLDEYRLQRAKRPGTLPPASIATWLKEGWAQPDGDPKVHSVMSFTETVHFAADSQRVSLFETWKQAREQWIAPELAARQAMRFYEKIYELYVSIEKDAENLELVLGDGRFQWLGSSELSGVVQIDHHILLKRVEVRFNPDVPEFVVVDTEREQELYSSLFVDLRHVMATAIRTRSDELARAGYHPLGAEDTTAFLRAFVQSVSPTKGEFTEAEPSEPISETPRLFRDAALVLRKRGQSITTAVDAILEHIEQQEVFPPALGQIISTDSEWNGAFLSAGNGLGGMQGITAGPGRGGINDDDILLAKEANEEQLQILRRLDRSGSVIVQGPPGTGKTHTIGNLIGHLLAQGKSILVTAQTAKALRVVRDKVPDMLRPLAVSVLGSDESARVQLEAAIGSITERMTSDSPQSLAEKTTRFEQERRHRLKRKAELRTLLRRALENEYREISVGSRRLSPAEAARVVREHQQAHSWIPSQISLGADLSLSNQEIARAYALGTLFTVEEAAECSHPMPDLDKLPDAQRFRAMVTEYQSLTSIDCSAGAMRWREAKGGSGSLTEVAVALQSEFSDDLRKQAWRPHAIVAGIHGEHARSVWEKVIELTEQAVQAQAEHALVMHQRPKRAAGMPLAAQAKAISEIQDHLAGGGKLGFLQLVTRTEWRQVIKTAAVAAGEPSLKEHFDALNKLVRMEEARQALQPLWDMLIGEPSGHAFATLGSAPEQSCRAVLPEIRRCLNWHKEVWSPLEQKLRNEGLMLDDVLATIPREASLVSEYLVIEQLAMKVLPPLLSPELVRRKIRECEQAFQDVEANVAAASEETAGATAKLLEAVRARDGDRYEKGLSYVQRLCDVKPLAQERTALLDRLGLVAPVWAEHIRLRTAPHDAAAVPGDTMLAWEWRQLHDELKERDQLSANEIQREIDKVDVTLRELTLHLIDAKAWGKQLERLAQSNSIRRALVGWLDTIKVLTHTRQEGRRQVLLSEARKLMKESATAVPVWVMPISIVAENFDPRQTRFDVVIIDEASQADLNALIPLYLGRQVIVVGDHEQVTPLGVGQGQAILENMRQQTLTDIPNSHLFDAKFSIYDIGRQSFGDAIRLVEHFRCVPEIIAFSNKLSYDGKIKPLRESNSSDLKPACVAMQVHGTRDRDSNLAEARRIIDMIKAMIAHPRYAQKSIGVVSMLGDQQTVLLQSMILKEIPGKEIESRRILAGNSSEFQGDERDVIFLSMVDSPQDEGPMRLSGDGAFELAKKRYNVAASRARDQLIVVHSFDPDLHLKPGDIRLRLMQHIADPWASLRAFQEGIERTESPFERAVLKLLTDAGYRVRTQWEVGYYRIDMVVEGGGKRLAVECDGDRYHPIEKLADDIERQTILERLGWQFVRIRGSAFYRDAEAAMRPVFDRLRELEIPTEAYEEVKEEEDFSLIHELQAILDGMVEGHFQSEQVNGLELTEEGRADEDDQDVVAVPSSEGVIEISGSDDLLDTGNGSAHSLLISLGGAVDLEQFLRHLAKTRGYIRLGKHVRAEMMGEVDQCIRAKRAVIQGKELRLLTNQPS